MRKQIRIVLGNSDGPTEVFIEAEDETGSSIKLDDEETEGGRDLVIDMVKPTRDYLKAALRKCKRQPRGKKDPRREVIKSLLEGLDQ